MRAIPKQLLVHTAVLYRIQTEDAWGHEELDDGTELRYVRMKYSGKVVRDKNNAEIQLAAVLFYDCRNSSPKNVEFQVDDIIVFNGEQFRVQTVELFTDEKHTHHYEMGLVKHA